MRTRQFLRNVVVAQAARRDLKPMEFGPIREWIRSRRDEMIRQVREWSAINTGSYNLDGLARQRDRLLEEFSVPGVAPVLHALGPEVAIDAAGRAVEHPLGQAISWRKRPAAPLQVLFSIHYDTVFEREHPFQTVGWGDAGTLVGPGVVDAKSGIAILFCAVRAIEQSSLAEKIGWEIFLGPDEELGSPGSAPLLRERAGSFDFGLLFEPALPDGALVGARMGSGNFSIVIRGRAAHVGREFHTGRSAIHRAAALVVHLAALNDAGPFTVNVGRIDGGGPGNVVSDLAIVRFNARVRDLAAMDTLRERFARMVAEVNAEDGLEASLFGDFSSPPKPFTDDTARLFDALSLTGAEEGLDLTQRSTGGVCDGNKLAAAGLPNIDTLGGRGGGAHSDQEFLIVDSLTERASLVALLVLKIAAGEIAWPRRRG